MTGTYEPVFGANKRYYGDYRYWKGLTGQALLNLDFNPNANDGDGDGVDDDDEFDNDTAVGDPSDVRTGDPDAHNYDVDWHRDGADYVVTLKSLNVKNAGTDHHGWAARVNKVEFWNTWGDHATGKKSKIVDVLVGSGDDREVSGINIAVDANSLRDNTAYTTVYWTYERDTYLPSEGGGDHCHLISLLRQLLIPFGTPATRRW